MLDTLIATFPFLITGFQYTVLISVAAIVLGSLAGFVLGMIRTVGPGFVRLIIGWYVHLIRATPFLVQILHRFLCTPRNRLGDSQTVQRFPRLSWRFRFTLPHM